MEQKKGCGTLAGWGALVSGIAALIAAVAGFWTPKGTDVKQPDLSSPVPSLSAQPGLDNGGSKNPQSEQPPSPEQLDPNAVVVDPIAIIQQMGATPLAAKDFYAGKTIVLRYDIKVDASTIESCSTNRSKRCIGVWFGKESLRHPVFIQCEFPESYTPYLSGLNKELFSSKSKYLLTLSGYIGDIDEVIRSPIYLKNCQVTNINRSA
jgi:hypothetical protein